MGDHPATGTAAHMVFASLTWGRRARYGPDRQASVRQPLSDAGSVLGSQNYDPYGTPEGTLGSAFGYTGERNTPVGKVKRRHVPSSA